MTFVLMLAAVGCVSAVEFETYFHDLTDPLEVVFVMDTSGSMTGAIEGVRSCVGNFVAALDDSGYDYRIGAANFADGTCFWDFDDTIPGYQMSADFSEFTLKLDSMGAAGGGDGPECSIDAIYDAANEYDWTPGMLRVLLMFTDIVSHYPDDSSGYSDVTHEDVLDFLLANGFVLYASVDTYGSTGYEPEYPGDSIYFHLSEMTGGRGYIMATTPWDTIFADMVDDIFLFYCLGVRVTGLSGHDLYEIELDSLDEFTVIGPRVIDLTGERYEGVDEFYVAWVMRYIALMRSTDYLLSNAAVFFTLRTSEGEFTHEGQISYTSPTSVRERMKTIPEQVSLTISPNPFNSACAISTPIGANIEIFDLNGKSVGVGLAPTQHQGDHEGRPYIWTPDKSISSGVYLIRATAQDGQIAAKRVVYLK